MGFTLNPFGTGDSSAETPWWGKIPLPVKFLIGLLLLGLLGLIVTSAMGGSASKPPAAAGAAAAGAAAKPAAKPAAAAAAATTTTTTKALCSTMTGSQCGNKVLDQSKSGQFCQTATCGLADIATCCRNKPTNQNKQAHASNNPCKAVAAPSNGVAGTCTAPLLSGATCMPTCNATYIPNAATCNNGVLVPAQCKAGPTVVRAKCDKTVKCPATQFLDVTKKCLGATCVVGDKNRCCTDNLPVVGATCDKTVKCPASQFLDVTKKCLGATCVVGDKNRCCRQCNIVTNQDKTLPGLTCTSLTNSRVTKCMDKHHKVSAVDNNTADRCDKVAPCSLATFFENSNINVPPNHVNTAQASAHKQIYNNHKKTYSWQADWKSIETKLYADTPDITTLCKTGDNFKNPITCDKATGWTIKTGNEATCISPAAPPTKAKCSTMNNKICAAGKFFKGTNDCIGSPCLKVTDKQCCTACTQVANADAVQAKSGLTCTTATNSQVKACNSNYTKDSSKSGTADTCVLKAQCSTMKDSCGKGFVLNTKNTSKYCAGKQCVAADIPLCCKRKSVPAAPVIAGPLAPERRAGVPSGAGAYGPCPNEDAYKIWCKKRTCQAWTRQIKAPWTPSRTGTCGSGVDGLKSCTHSCDCKQDGKQAVKGKTTDIKSFCS